MPGLVNTGDLDTATQGPTLSSASAINHSMHITLLTDRIRSLESDVEQCESQISLWAGSKPPFAIGSWAFPADTVSAPPQTVDRQTAENGSRALAASATEEEAAKERQLKVEMWKLEKGRLEEELMMLRAELTTVDGQNGPVVDVNSVAT